MENFNEGQNNPSDLMLNADACSHLLVARKWSMFLAVFGLIACGIMMLAFLALFFMNTMDSIFPFGTMMFFPYALIMLLYIFPLYYLLQFSTLSKRAITHQDSGLLTQAMFNLKRHYRFMGILIIIILILYAVMILYMAYFLGGSF